MRSLTTFQEHLILLGKMLQGGNMVTQKLFLLREAAIGFDICLKWLEHMGIQLYISAQKS
jgi:hypothetical protein